MGGVDFKELIQLYLFQQLQLDAVHPIIHFWQQTCQEQMNLWKQTSRDITIKVACQSFSEGKRKHKPGLKVRIGVTPSARVRVCFRSILLCLILNQVLFVISMNPKLPLNAWIHLYTCLPQDQVTPSARVRVCFRSILLCLILNQVLFVISMNPKLPLNGYIYIHAYCGQGLNHQCVSDQFKPAFVQSPVICSHLSLFLKWTTLTAKIIAQMGGAHS